MDEYAKLKWEVIKRKRLYLGLRRWHIPGFLAWRLAARTLVPVRAAGDRDRLLSLLREDVAVTDGLDDAEARALMRLAEKMLVVV